MTFEEAGKRWFDEYACLFQRKTTFTRNKQLSKRTYERFGKCDISSITRTEIQRFLNDLNKTGVSKRDGKPLAQKTRKHYLTFISDVFRFCVDEEMISETPCKNIRVAPDVYDDAKEEKLYSIDEAKELLKFIEIEAPLKYRCFFYLALTSGMRRSELIGLEWRDINFISGVISITRVGNYTSATGKYTDVTKTKGSNRCVIVPRFVVDMLAEFRKEQPYNRVFVQADGQPMHSNTPYNWLKRECEKRKLPFYGVHKFRHLYASVLINSGLDVATVSRCLGHSQISTTLNIYAHAFNNAYIKGCTAVSEALKSLFA